jgi:nucleoside-diphosphate-sugar epimerase
VILVTGATGFIGSYLLRELKESGADLRVVSRNKVMGVDSVVCDFLSEEIPSDIFDGVDTVFHLAGVAHDTTKVVESIYQKINVESTVRLAELAAKSGVKRFIFVSSVKAGGSGPGGHCADEDSQGTPEGIYGRTKREAEIKLLALGREKDIHIAIIRPALVYGPKMKGNLKVMLSSVRQGRFPPLPETFNSRSMVFLGDLVAAIRLVADNDNANGEIFIVTDGVAYSSREIYNEMCQAVGRNVPRWFVPYRVFWLLAKLGDIFSRFINVPFDSYRLNKLLGDDCYKSDKIRRELGFVSVSTLKDVLPKILEDGYF